MENGANFSRQFTNGYFERGKSLKGMGQHAVTLSEAISNRSTQSTIERNKTPYRSFHCCTEVEEIRYSEQETKLVSEQHGSNSTGSKYTKRQCTIFLALMVIQFFSSVVYSLQGPFFPREAEKKGISPAVYGFVFGVYELVKFIVCPLYGNHIKEIGTKFMLCAGSFVVATCCIIYSFLSRCPPGLPFICLAFAIRIVEALGRAGFITAAYVIIASEFPESIATTFSLMETLYAIGAILGPIVGAFLYDTGGFLLVFSGVGGVLWVAACLTTLMLPIFAEDLTNKKVTLRQLIHIPDIVMYFFVSAASSFTVTFLQPVLEPYLKQFDLPLSLVSMLFIINSGVYALTASLWGVLADRYINPKLLCGLGSVFIIFAFLFMGPAIFIPLTPSVWLIIVALVLHGFGGAEYIAAFLDCNREVLKHGFSDSTETYGMVSAIWASGSSLGSFLGPSVAGVLYSAIGFRNACLVNVCLHVCVGVFSFTSFACKKKKTERSHVSILD